MNVTPLLDFFKRSDVERDVRLLAAQGGLAPRAHEQLGILVLLLDDADPEIRQTAESTVSRIPVDVLSAVLARSELPPSLRAFFAGRGIVPADTPAEDLESPLVDAGASVEDARDGEADRESTVQRLAKMTFPERLKAAIKGSREMRMILVRDPNKMIAAAVMSSPKMNDSEVEGIARMASVSEDVLRIIGSNRGWIKNYKIAAALARNPKTPVALSLTLLSRLNERDLAQLSVDRNVSEPVRIAARKKVMAGGH